MNNFARVRRAVYQHEWETLKEWAVALDDLADLADRDIDALVCGDKPTETQSTCC